MTNPLKTPVAGKKLRAAIIDMQPITPAVGGGRQRLLGLYHALGENIEATYIGSYDWPGEPYKDIQLTPGLREIVVPLSDAHHLAAKQAADKVGGKVVIDCLFSEQAVLSPAFLDEARRHITEADVVVFSHPWAFPPLEADLSPNQLVVYDSQNVEVLLRTQLFPPSSSAEGILRTVAAAEYGLCRRADLVLACSHADREMFSRIYDLSFAKIRVVPNGIFTFEGTMPSIEEREQAKSELGVGGQQLCIFIGSNYEPNNEAARFIALKLATSLPSVRFVIVGGCAGALADTPVAGNVEVVGVVDENSK